MTTTTHSVPVSCDVLVVGAGPAGSACAQRLARAGLSVVLCDRQDFPRDKVCGDALIPDAHHALARLGVLDDVLARAAPSAHIACIAPRGGRVEVPGRLAVLPRRELDDILRRAAMAAGAAWLAPARFEAALLDADDRVIGARLHLSNGQHHELRAHWTVLATGADSPALIAAGMCERRAPSGVALRAYVRNDAMAARINSLEIVWHRGLRRGYGWIFPCGRGVFNVGVGLTHGRAHAQGPAAAREPGLRELFADFVQVYAPARELMQGGVLQGELKGAPLRCSLDGSRWSRPGLLVAGEAAGSTYLLTGEGIGKALETGMLAAQALCEAALQDDGAVRARYESALTALKPRFATYAQANRINERPWMADLLVWRASRSERVRRRLVGVLEESYDPSRFVDAKGLLGLVFT
ncbi:NAD(P)/FAD-dependent oxidoreductase [Variovorax sp. J22R133]|uniref:geranylgeranyl reductase family protein n=1 Tax=Variovorax brevis TaxID=3053503 RepID=UPI0025781E46|nr:NAD(P)/FAD-dependent oxidoreductase [Variovorax sp. J22R133]MDM0115321.1 NAD(P)/FAD-dependent oxidoreductase [Variovorax sp. J22R133]